jgi:uncharacterized membrane protein
MDVPRNRLDWVLEAFSAVCVIAPFVWLALVWDQLPARVPRHFGPSGAPNAWGDKSGLLTLPVVGIVGYALLSAAARYQGLINVPMDVNREDPAVRSLLQSMVIVIKLSMMLLFGYITWGSVQTALGKTHGLGLWFLPFTLLSSLLPLGYYLMKLRPFRR